MAKETTMKTVGYFACNPDTLKPEWGEDCVCQDDVYDPEETGTVGRPFVFATQAEAYADARVLEAQQWISVEDRLPNDGDSVMFVVDCQNPGWHHLHGKVLGGTYRDSGFGVPGLSIGASHWMPLPAPPTE